MEESENLLVVDRLVTQFFTYGGVVEALDEVSFEIYEGEIFGLVGESGCGKSVTASSILGLVAKPGKVISGSILLDGEDLLTKSQQEMNKVRGSRISIIFQDPTSSLNPLFRIGYQVAEPYIYHQKKQKKSAIREATTILEMTGLPDPSDKAKNYPHELSGGMRQRAMIAMALTCQPDLLIADEPTTNLDVTIERQILDLVKALQADFGTSVLWITHDMAVIAQICDRVAVMYAGNIVEKTDVRTLFRNPKHPYTVQLLRAIPSAVSFGEDLEEIPGSVPRLIRPPTGCRFHPRCDHATAICSEVKPEEIALEPGHTVACHLYKKVEESS
ncbi:MAG TPA: ABC transporter ATP-binding protein [Candidatus Heimdallarchaeota archaeon]|nr:ABC transporter ATP-binding protein [Candidatus Heimdallarchaeota archaeon]